QAPEQQRLRLGQVPTCGADEILAELRPPADPLVAIHQDVTVGFGGGHDHHRKLLPVAGQRSQYSAATTVANPQPVVFLLSYLATAVTTPAAATRWRSPRVARAERSWCVRVRLPALAFLLQEHQFARHQSRAAPVPPRVKPSTSASREPSLQAGSTPLVSRAVADPIATGAGSQAAPAETAPRRPRSANLPLRHFRHATPGIGPRDALAGTRRPHR